MQKNQKNHSIISALPEPPAPVYERAALKITVFRTEDVIAASSSEELSPTTSKKRTTTLYEGKLRM